MATISKAVIETNIEKIEAAVQTRLQLESDLQYLRIKWKGASLEARPGIEEEARSLIATIEAMPEFPPLTALARREGTQEVLDDLAILLSWFNDQLNITNKLNADQIEVVALTIMGEYGHLLRLEDLAACLRRALKGEYGQIYARLDAAVVLDWLNRYETDLTRDRINRADDRHANLKESRHDDRYSSDDRDKFRAAMNSYISNQHNATI